MYADLYVILVFKCAKLGLHTKYLSLVFISYLYKVLNNSFGQFVNNLATYCRYTSIVDTHLLIHSINDKSKVNSLSTCNENKVRVRG